MHNIHDVVIGLGSFALAVIVAYAFEAAFLRAERFFKT